MKKVIVIVLFQLAVSAGYAQTDTVAVFAKSYVSEGNKEYGKAIEAMGSIYSANSYIINLRLGWLWYLNGDYVKAQLYYKNAITLDSKSIEARLGYAFPSAALENWNEVISVYNEILNIDPENSFVNYKMAYIFYYIKKDYAGSLAYVNVVTKYFPFDYESNLLTAQIHLSLGNIKEAKEAVQKALEYNPSSKEALKVNEALK